MTNPDESAPSFNLWTENWLTLEKPNGELVDVSIHEALLHADRYAAIYDISPLVVVGIQRLLTAILQDALDPQENADLEQLWQEGCFPAGKIEQFGRQYADRFDLFSPDKPFMQSADLPLFPQTKDEIKQSKPIATIFPETPSGTEIAHYRHGVEDDVVLSPANAAIGLLLIPPFMSSGGGGGEFMPSINGAPPPIYIIPGGKTLFESLCASLVSGTHLNDQLVQGDLAWWKRDVPIVVERSKKKSKEMSFSKHKQLSTVGYLRGLTFPSRKVRLHPEKMNAICSRSGKISEWCVRTMTFRMGESLLNEGGNWWRDPFVAYRLPDKDGKKPRTIKASLDKATWREFTCLFLQKGDNTQQAYRPRFIDQLSDLSIGEEMSVYPFRCIALVAKADAKKFDWFDFGFDVPPLLLQDMQGANWTNDAISQAEECAKTISSVFSREFSRATKNSERLKRVKERMISDYWSVLGGKFRQFVLDLGNREQQEQTRKKWKNTALHEAIRIFDSAAESTGNDGASLHLIEEGKSKVRHELFNPKKVKKGGRNAGTRK